MCLEINLTRHPKNNPKIADRDILCFKIVYNSNISEFRDFRYKEGTHYTETEGMFVYGYEWSPSKYVSRGFHSFTSIPNALSWGYNRGCQKIVKFYIPKGAKYFIGKKGQMASDQIMCFSLDAVEE